MDTPAEVLSIALAGVSLVTTLTGMAYIVGVKFATLESRMQGLAGIPERVTSLETKVDAMWEVFMHDAMVRQARAGNLEMRSDPVLTGQAGALIPEHLRGPLKGLRPAGSLAEAARAVLGAIPLDEIERLSLASGCLPSDIMVLFAAYHMSNRGGKSDQ
jgi:hypothetical protein